jgi:hypothetical protein
MIAAMRTARRRRRRGGRGRRKLAGVQEIT